MGRHLSTNQCAHLLGGRTSYCKLKYLISVLRNLHGYARRPFKTTKIKRYYTSFSSDHRFRNGVREVEYLQAVPFCSSSDRDVLKVKAPVGLFQDTQTTSQLYVLGARLGESFNRLSRHINVYFKPKDVPLAPVAGNPNFLLTTPEPCSKLQRRSQRAARETRVFQDQDTTHTPKSGAKKNISETQPEPETRPRLQLFHISSLATRFGESYSYVANHINSVFSGRPAINFQIQDTVEDLSSAGGSSRRQRRRKMQKEQNKISVEADKPTQSAAVEDNTFNKRVEGYLLIATHINRYFGAKVADTADCGRIHKEKIVGENGSTYQKESSERSASETQRALSQQEQEEHPIPRTQGLFHTSSNTAHFGESYFETANHINRYFQSASAEDVDMNPVRGMETETAATKRLKAVSFMDRLMHPSTSIPYLLGSYLKLEPWAQSGRSKPDAAAPETAFMRRASQVLNRRQADDMTYELICNLRQVLSPDALTACVEALNEHLIRYPSCREIMWQEKTAVKLLKQRRRHRDNDGLQSAIRETLALIGYVDPVKGHGIRVLSIDGGGTRGVVPLQVLKLLEAETGKQIHQLFDYICGVSTGAVLAFMLGLARFSLEECADMYRRFGSDVFRQNPLVGTVKMGWSHSYYNTETWETILREKMGEKVLIRTSRDELSPKVSAVSAVVNWGNSPKAFVFRNYNHTPGSLSRYAGGSGYEMWQAVRASSAAPGYFQEFPLQSDIHQDGGIILNNPCALAVHESRLLWPNQHFQCVLSLGTGRYDNVKRGPATSTTLRAKISNLISSATDTEGVHTLLDDLLAPDVYFRFNPMLSAEVSLDESRPGALDQLKKDTQVYLERNRLKLARLCLVLGPERSAMSHTKDWLSERAWEVKQRWV